jgi:hypothetical protein
MMHKIGTVFRPRLFLYLIRALIPRWNFFDHVNYQFELEFKIAEAQSWEKVTFHQKKDLFGLLVNPETNIDMAKINIIEHFAYDIQDIGARHSQLRFKDVQRLTSFKLLKALLELKIQSFVISNRTIQFKIVAANLKERKDIYISDWFQLGESV